MLRMSAAGFNGDLLQTYSSTEDIGNTVKYFCKISQEILE
jgi:hypothetical protein